MNQLQRLQRRAEKAEKGQSRAYAMYFQLRRETFGREIRTATDGIITPQVKNIFRLLLNNTTWEQCSICRDPLKDSTVGTVSTVIILRCTHIFHKNCIMNWISRNPTCPYCRAPSEIVCDLDY